MKDRLIIQTCDDDHTFTRYLDYSRSVHAAYADACDADYEVFIGRKQQGAIGLWNRYPMILDAFASGYRKIVYMDVDTLVIRPKVDIFAETGTTTPLLMAHMGYEHSVFNPWSQYEDGVMVVNNTAVTKEMFQWIWDRRTDPLLDHHHPDFFDQNWLHDYIANQPTVVAALDPRFDYVPNSTWSGPFERATILGFHGLSGTRKWAAYRGALVTYAEIETTPEDAW